jgi:hypothetical protein
MDLHRRGHTDIGNSTDSLQPTVTGEMEIDKENQKLGWMRVPRPLSTKTETVHANRVSPFSHQTQSGASGPDRIDLPFAIRYVNSMLYATRVRVL